MCPGVAPLGGSTFAEANYRANGGTGFGNVYQDAYSTTRYGPLYAISRVRIRDIRDGTSNTYAVDEGTKIAGSSTARPRWCGNTSAYYAIGDTERPINSVESSSYGYKTFASVHEGGGFFLFCDGQVRFLSENIDTTTYRALATIANNEIIDDEDY
jgi:uncharacterized protein DUF1559